MSFNGVFLLVHCINYFSPFSRADCGRFLGTRSLGYERSDRVNFKILGVDPYFCLDSILVYFQLWLFL